MRQVPFALFFLIVLVTSCQDQKPPSPVIIPVSETLVPSYTALPTHTPTPIVCEPQPPIVELASLPKIPDDNLPAPRYSANIAYDQSRQVIVLFGGFPDNDTWEYDGLEWKRIVTNTRPQNGSYQSMAYDPKREVMVMYGDFGDKIDLYSVWEYDGTDWREAKLENIPDGIRFPVLTYYPPWEKIIMFGEYQDSGTYQTWTYDGSSWQNLDQGLHSTPIPSMLYQTVYDSCRRKLYLQKPEYLLGDWTYEFNGDTWQVVIANEHRPYLPIPFASMVYDTRRSVIVLYGTFFGEEGRSETWEYDGVTWQQVFPLASPPTRAYHAMAFDEERGVTVMFGGVTEDGIYLNDTWEYDGTTWVQR